MDVKRIGESLGAEIQGVDIRNASDSQIDEVYEALLEHEVIFFRNVDLDDEAHQDFAARFGEVSVFPIFKVMGETNPTFQIITDGPESKPAADYWHTDVTWTEEPPRAAFLRATVVPATGGNTKWASMTAAYEALSPKVREFFESLTVHHDNTSFIDGMYEKMGDAAKDLATALRADYPGVDHPLIRTHPETGRRAILHGGYFMRHIVDLEESESEAIFDFLRSHIDDPRFQVTWKWQLGDLAVWDERSTVHRGCGDHFPQAREVRRCVIDGDRPFFRAA